MDRGFSEDLVAESLTESILSRLRQTLALLLWEKRAVRVDAAQPFKLASGNRSPIYVDCRCVISDPHFLRLYAAVAGQLLERRGAHFDVVAGGETAGIPFAVALAQALAKPVVYVRKKAKDYGVANRVEGALPPAARVLLVEDLITDGGSKLTFLDALEAAGATVADALVLFDRNQGGSDLLATRGVRLHAVTDRRTTFAVGHGAGLLDDATLESVDAYFENPAAWHEAHGFAWHAAE